MNKNIRSDNQEKNKLIYFNQKTFEDEDNIDISEIIRFLRRRALIIVGITITLATIFSTRVLVKPKVYEGRFRLLVESLNTDKSELDFLAALSEGNYGQFGRYLDYESQINVLKSPLVMNPIIEEIQSSDPQIKKGHILSNLSVERLDQTKIIEIAYKNPSQERILLVLNQIIKGYLDYKEREYITNLSQAKSFTQDQINRVRQDVSNSASKLQNFQKINNLIDPVTNNEAVVTNSQTLLQQVTDVKIELNEKTKLAEELGKKLELTPEEGVIVSRLNQDPNLTNLLSKIKEIEAEISAEETMLRATHPSLVTLKAKKQGLVSLLNQETRKILGSDADNISLDFLTSIPQNVEITQQFFETNNQIEVLKTREKVLNQALTEINQQIDALPSQNKEYYEIQRELNTANESLNRLLALNETLQIEEAKQSSPWQLLTPINEGIIRDVSGKRRQITFITIASLFSSILVAFLIDKLDSVIHSVQEIKNTIDLPSLAIIPFNKQLSLVSRQTLNFNNLGKDLITDNDINLNLDAYISLYTNINFLSSDNPIRSIVIAATEANEGKTTTSAFLGKAAAIMGKKVLIVDTDMRKPKLHKYTGLHNSVGLSNLIVDDLGLDKVIQPSNQENLFVITSGSKVPNPTRIFSSQKMQALMQKLKQDFDFIIYDTAPLMGFSDAKIITPMTDGIVFVIGLGQAHRPNVKRVIDDLKVSNLPVLGVVANGAKKNTESYYNYYNYKKYYQESVM